MKITHRIIIPLSAVIAFALGTFTAFAQETVPASGQAAESATVITATSSTTAPAPTVAPAKKSGARNKRSINDSAVVKIGSDAVIPAGSNIRTAVAIGGSVQADNEADQTVAIFGSNTVNASVNHAVAVGGNVYVNSHVTGDVVAVAGSVELGPDARVDGQVVALGGPIKRDPTSSIGGHIVEFKLFNDMVGLQAWFQHALGKARLLAFSPGLGWAWMIAGFFLVCHLLIALLFPKAVTASAEALEQRPGGTLLTAFLTLIVVPLLCVVLSVTVIGTLMVVLLALAASFVGKAGLLAWLGRRITKPIGVAHPALAVLIGGVLLMLAYCVPILGIVLWQITKFLAPGLAVYAAILALRRRRDARATAVAAASASQQTAAAPFTSGANSAVTDANTTASLGNDAPTPSAEGQPSSALALPATPSATLPPPLVSAKAPHAGFWIRLAALLIDVIIVSFVSNLLHTSSHMFAPPRSYPDFLILAVYFAAMWALCGTTLGGSICRLKVVRRDGKRLDWTTAIVRVLGGFVSFAVLCLGFIWIAFDPERESWHDKIAGTVVIRVPRDQQSII